MSYIRYLKKWDKKHGTKQGLPKTKEVKAKKEKPGKDFVMYGGKLVRLSAREKGGGGIFANYKDTYKNKR